MKIFLTLVLVCGIATAGVRIGGRLGYYSGDDPRTGQDASSAIFGGQLSFPIMSLLELEISGSYTSSETDISMQQYLISYIEDEYGQNYEGDSLGLFQYLEDEWGWSPDSLTSQLLSDYTATFHDVGLGATMKMKIPIGTLPLKPYVGAGGGAHMIFSDADVLLQVVNEETGGSLSIDPYDKVHPGIHGVVGVSFEPPMVPLSVFGEYKYTKPIGSGSEMDGISMYYIGLNLGF